MVNNQQTAPDAIDSMSNIKEPLNEIIETKNEETVEENGSDSF